MLCACSERLISISISSNSSNSSSKREGDIETGIDIEGKENDREASEVLVKREVHAAAATWRLLVSSLPKELIIPLLREGSTNPKTPGM